MKTHRRAAGLALALASSFALALALAPAAAAAVPGQVAYQGLLLDDLGAPVTATVAMDFQLFDAAVAGVSLWSESHPAVQVVDGVYEVNLGATTPLTPALLSGGSVHLEVTIDGETLTPRQQLLAVPYAHRAEVAESAEGMSGLSSDYFLELLQHADLDGGPPSNLHPDEGLADPDGDGVANFVDPDNDGDGIPDVSELGTSDINLVTPTLTGFSPPTADGFETNAIQVQGTSFEAGLSVAFGADTPTPSSITSTSFDVTVGPQAEGPATVTVTLPNGEQATTTYDFFYLEPSVDAFSPARFDEGQAGTITVTGQNFIAGMTVQFGAQSPTPTSITPTSFEIAVAGTEPPGLVPVTVTLPNGKQDTNATGFEVSVGSPRVIFVTAAEHTGALGGLANADAVCQSAAGAAGLPGTFQAWLADSTGSPATRESRVGAPYRRTDGATIANDWADLVDGSIAVPVDRDENGSPGAGGVLVWTNVAAVGGGVESANDCSRWGTNSGFVGGRRGDRSAIDATWTQVGTGSFCNASHHLYCVEQ